MIGSIIGAGIGAAGSIIGGAKSAKSMRNYKRSIEQQQRENQDWYDRRYNEDATQRADAQRLLTLTEEKIRNRNRAAAGQQAVTGGTAESVAAEKEANAAALASAVSSINAQGEARKDNIEAQYLSRKDELEDKLQSLEVAKANNLAQSIQGVASAAGSIGSAIDESMEDLHEVKNQS